MPETPFKDNGPARRKNARREFLYSAILVGADNKQWPASIVDISNAGAQLNVQNASDMPETFSLLIGGKSAVKRDCVVIWRSEARIGVKFNHQSGQPKPS